MVYMTKDDIGTKKSYIPSKIFGAEFTLAIGCKLDCHYCPQRKLIQRYLELFKNDDLIMKFSTFQTCLEKIERGAGINFSGMVEPFHNKECAKMIKYAYNLGYKIAINTTLVGVTDEDLEILKDVHFDYIKLHIPDQQGNSKFPITDEYLDILKKFSSHFGVDIYSCHGEIHDTVKDYLKDGRKIACKMMNRAGNLEFEELRKYGHKGKIACACGDTDRGWKPEILPNGTVVLCCMDYGLEHILGNLIEQDWNEILCGKEFIAFEQGLENEKLPCLCRKCSTALPSNHPALLDSRVLGENAIRIARVLEKFSQGEISESELSIAYSPRSAEIVKKLVTVENVCVFGLGKLFRENYFQSLWYNIIKANIFSDNDEKKWGTTYCDTKCIAPEELTNIDSLLVVTYVKDDNSIREQLKEMGVKDIINVYEIFNLLCV